MRTKSRTKDTVPTVPNFSNNHCKYYRDSKSDLSEFCEQAKNVKTKYFVRTLYAALVQKMFLAPPLARPFKSQCDSSARESI